MKTEKKVGFTPGPWEFGEPWNYGGNVGEALAILANGRDIALLPFEYEPYDVATNGWPIPVEITTLAHLIAAAPDLYEACKKIRYFIAEDFLTADSCVTPEYRDAWESLKAAMAKANGEAS